MARWAARRAKTASSACQAKHGDEFADQFLDAVGFIQHRAEFLLEDERAQARAEILQVVLQVLAHEEIGIRKAGAHHVFVALADQVEPLFVAVADDDEIRQQRAGSSTSSVGLRT